MKKRDIALAAVLIMAFVAVVVCSILNIDYIAGALRAGGDRFLQGLLLVYVLYLAGLMLLLKIATMFWGNWTGTSAVVSASVSVMLILITHIRYESLVKTSMTGLISFIITFVLIYAITRFPFQTKNSETEGELPTE